MKYKDYRNKIYDNPYAFWNIFNKDNTIKRIAVINKIMYYYESLYYIMVDDKAFVFSFSDADGENDFDRMIIYSSIEAINKLKTYEIEYLIEQETDYTECYSLNTMIDVRNCDKDTFEDWVSGTGIDIHIDDEIDVIENKEYEKIEKYIIDKEVLIKYEELMNFYNKKLKETEIF